MAVVALLLPFWLGTPAGTAASPDAPTPPLDLGPYAGRVVYVDFWASWCAPCKVSLPWLQELQSRHGDEGLTVLLVNVDRDRKAADAMLAKAGITLPITWDPDGRIAKAYGLEGMPSSFVYGRDGQLRDRHVGFDPRHADDLERSVTTLLAEPVSPAAAPKEGGS
jgi:thiol-disulfide isomerase/thioredoxin